MEFTDRPQSCSFLGLPYRILFMNPKKELLWGLWVVSTESTATQDPKDFIFRVRQACNLKFQPT